MAPIAELEHQVDLDPDLLAHLTTVAQTIGKAIDGAFRPAKVGLMIAGLELPHVHIQVSPINSVTDLDLANAGPNESPKSLSTRLRIGSGLRWPN